jgi:hypothetical protein
MNQTNSRIFRADLTILQEWTLFDKIFLFFVVLFFFFFEAGLAMLPILAFTCKCIDIPCSLHTWLLKGERESGSGQLGVEIARREIRLCAGVRAFSYTDLCLYHWLFGFCFCLHP